MKTTTRAHMRVGRGVYGAHALGEEEWGLLVTVSGGGGGAGSEVLLGGARCVVSRHHAVPRHRPLQPRHRRKRVRVALVYAVEVAFPDHEQQLPHRQVCDRDVRGPRDPRSAALLQELVEPRHVQFHLAGPVLRAQLQLLRLILCRGRFGQHVLYDVEDLVDPQGDEQIVGVEVALAPGVAHHCQALREFLSVHCEHRQAVLVHKVARPCLELLHRFLTSAHSQTYSVHFRDRIRRGTSTDVCIPAIPASRSVCR
eukprot:230831-Rhodomonas_salina.1